MHIRLRVAHKAQINNEFFKSIIEILFSFVKDSAGENNDKEYLLTLASSFWSYSMQMLRLLLPSEMNWLELLGINEVMEEISSDG